MGPMCPSMPKIGGGFEAEMETVGIVLEENNPQ